MSPAHISLPAKPGGGESGTNSNRQTSVGVHADVLYRPCSLRARRRLESRDLPTLDFAINTGLEMQRFLSKEWNRMFSSQYQLIQRSFRRSAPA